VVVVAAHGSRAAAANDAHRAVVSRLADQVPVPVVPAFLELTEPSIAEAIDRAVAGGATTVAVLPYFLHPGRHLTEDLPRIVTEAAARHPGAVVRLAPSFGADPALGEVLASQVVRAVDGA
jgi:sirohydrochlorin ferrochelatase